MAKIMWLRGSVKTVPLQINGSGPAMVAGRLANIPHGGDRRSDQAARVPLETSIEQAAAFAIVHGMFYRGRMSRYTLSDVRELTLTIECEQCGRRGRYAVAKLIEKYGRDAKLPDLRQTLANCQKTKTANIYDRCKAVFEKPSTE
jgi:hypothetical protein